MLKIGSAVHTAHGPGTVTDTETTRGRTQYKVAGQGFSVWVDETKVAALGDVDESNSTTLPYDYTPQHPTEMYDEEQTITPDHEVDLDERMTPTNSVTGESEGERQEPGPSPDLFATAYRHAYSDQENFQADFADDLRTGEPLDEQQHRFIQYLTRFDNMAENAKKSAQNLEASTRMAAPGSLNHYMQWAQQAGLQADQDATADLYGQTHGVDGYGILDKLKSKKGANRTAAGGWGDAEVGGDYAAPAAPAARPGSFDHYINYARQNGLHPGENMTADRYSREHSVPLQNTTNWANQFNNGRQKGMGARPAPTSYQMHPRFTGSIHEAYPGKHRKAPEPEMMLPGEVEVWDSEDWNAAHPDPVFDDPRDQARYEEYIKKLDPQFGDRRLDSFEPIYASRPAGLSDKYIDLPQHVAAYDDPVAQFRNDPLTALQRTAYLDLTSGLDPRVGEYMDLVEADPSIRTAAWNDVLKKAMRLRREGKVHVHAVDSNAIYANVEGDNGNYEVMILTGMAYPDGGFSGGKQAIANWKCACEWGKWAFKRKITYVGRLCSHGYATYLEQQRLGGGRKKRRTSAAAPGEPGGPHKTQGASHTPVHCRCDMCEGRRQQFVDDAPNRMRRQQELDIPMGIRAPRTPEEHEFSRAIRRYVEKGEGDPQAIGDYVRKNMILQEPGKQYDTLDDYYADLPRPDDDALRQMEKWGPSKYLDHMKRRTSSVLNDYKSWVNSDNNGVVDVPGADAFMSQMDSAPTSEDAKAVYDYVYDNFSERPQRNYDVDGYTMDPNEVWDGGNGMDNPTLRSQGKPPRLSPDLYRVPDPADPTTIDVEKDERKTTGPDQITAKVDKKWAKDHADKDDEHNPIVHFSMRKEALTYTADEKLLEKLRDLSAESPTENLGNMAERNREVAEVVSELRDRGYDASLFVAMRRQADSADSEQTRQNIKNFISDNVGPAVSGLFSPNGWKDTSSSSGPQPTSWGKNPNTPLPGGGDPALSDPATVKAPSPSSAPQTPGLAPATPAKATTSPTPSSGGNTSGGGGGDWKANSGGGEIGPGKYTIQKGDTYSDLAQRAGWGDDYKGFAQSTGYQANDPDKIFAGDTIDVKAKPGSQPSAAPAGEASNPAPEPGAAAPMSGVPGTPPAPGPAPADGTSGQYAPNPGPPNSTSFNSPPTPGPDAGIGATLSSNPDPVGAASAGGTYSGGGDMTNPSLMTPARVSNRRFLAEEDDNKPKPGDPIDGSGQSIQSVPEFGKDQNGTPLVSQSQPTTPNTQTNVPVLQPGTGRNPYVTPEPSGPKSTGVDPLPQMTTENFNNRPPAPQSEPSDGSKMVLEDRQPQGATSTSGMGGMGDFSNTVMPILEGVGGALMPMVTQTVAPIATGIGTAIGNGLSGLFTASNDSDFFNDGTSAEDPVFAGSGPSRKDFYSTSEEWHDHHEYEDLVNGEGDLVGYKTQPKQAGHEWDEKSIRDWVKRHDPSFRDDEKEPIRFIREEDDDNSDIVAAFQRNAANSALAGPSGGGSYSDDAIAQAAQGFLRTAGRVYSQAEQQELMDESHPKGARNLPGLDLRGTHYLEG